MNKLENTWHLRLFSKSIAKKAKLKALLRFLPLPEGKVCLDMGGDNGIISYFLRQRGGTWNSVDLNEQAVQSIRSLVGTNVYRTEGAVLPFPDKYFDLAVIIDFLEHIPDDKACIDELSRVMKRGAVLIVNVPLMKKLSLIRGMRNMLGLTDEQHGHVRPGYTLKGLRSLLGDTFTVTGAHTYSRFFTELVDIGIALGCAASTPRGVHSNKGILITGDQLAKSAAQFRVYSIAYPFMWIFSRLDALCLFTRGHRLVVKCFKA